MASEKISSERLKFLRAHPLESTAHDVRILLNEVAEIRQSKLMDAYKKLTNFYKKALIYKQDALPQKDVTEMFDVLLEAWTIQKEME